MSLCILHRDGWVVADTKVTWQSGRTGPFKVKKFVKLLGHTIVAQVGEWGVLDLMRADDTLADATENATKVVTVLSAWMAKKYLEGHKLDAELVILDRHRSLTLITETGSVLPIVGDDFYCAGAGEDVAWGYLTAVRERVGVVRATDAEAAVMRASVRHLTVGAESTIDQLQQ